MTSLTKKTNEKGTGMRLKPTQQQYFDFSTESTLKVVNEYREKYNTISNLLGENPQLVSLVQQGKISHEKLRMDTTVYETNIHYPTDSSLLWDSFRALANLLQNIQQVILNISLFPEWYQTWR
jgi:hypothetical protein